MARQQISYFHRKLLTGVLHVVAHPLRTLIISGLILVACAALAVWKLDIVTDQDQLFSRDVPFFKNYIEFTKNFPENQANYVIVEPRDSSKTPAVDRWTDLADAITDRLRRETRFVQSVDSHVPLEDLGSQGMLFEDPAKLPEHLRDVRRLLPLAKLWGESPSIVTGLLGSSPLERFISGVGLQPIDSETTQFLKLLADGWNDTLKDLSKPVRLDEQVPDLTQLGAASPSDLGYYYVKNDQQPDHYLLLVRVFEKTNYTTMGGLAESIDGIRSAVREEAAKFPEFTVALTGRPALEADEMVTTDHDSRRSEIFALIAVFVGLVVLLRSIWLAVAAEIALLVGIGWTFGWATIAVGELNLLSMVFLIALIGIGMDYLIQVLTRYRRESALHADPCTIWAAVFKYVAAPINTACLGAAGAFFVSVFTDFRGAAELGIIASGGLVLCLLAGYIILPALLTLFPVKTGKVELARIEYEPPPSRSHHWWLALPALWAALLLAGSPFSVRTRFDPSLLNMQASNLESVQMVRKLQTWSAVVLSKDVDLLQKIRSATEKLSTVASTESILGAYDNYAWMQQHKSELPTVNWANPAAVTVGDLPRLAGKFRSLAGRFRGPTTQPIADAASTATALEAVAAAIDSTDKKIATDRLSQWQNIFVDDLKRLIANFHPQPLEVAKLPGTLRDHLVGTDGRFALYLYPKDDLWNQPKLERFVNEVEAAVQTVPGSPQATGIAINIYHSTSSIERSFYHATAYALGLIFLLVLVDLRNLLQTLLAISVLAMGLPMLVALMGVFHVNWNFANFFGLPILIGAGHEYGVFMVHRYNEARSDPRRAWRGWDVSDRALLLCAFVTSASFGFFWAMAHHQGLRSLGLVMALGTACIYAATLCMLRPLLLWKLAQYETIDTETAA